MTEYNIVIEDAGPNYSAYVVGLDGAISTGTTVEEVTEKMREALGFHLEGMRSHGGQSPRHLPIVKTVHVASEVRQFSTKYGVS